MKKLFQKILSILMSILMGLGIPFGTTVDIPVKIDKHSIDQDVSACDSDTDELYIQQKLAERNQIPHEYLSGYYTNDGTEITVTGFRAISYNIIGYRYIFVDYEDKVLRIPDEIDGVPVTEIDIGAFEDNAWGSLTGFKMRTYILGNNIKKINGVAFTSFIASYQPWETCFPSIVAGKNIKDLSSLVECGTVYCYENSDVHKWIQSMGGPNPYYFKNFSFIDESHLTSEVAEIDENGNVRGLPSGLTKETVNDYLSVDGGAIMEISDEVIGTGTTIKLIHSEYGTIDNTYTVIMDGDINGDGSVNTSDDTAAMRKIITGSDSEFSEANKKAADLNGDGLINSTDLILMKSMQN